jgi:hypothetical protein
MRGWGNLGRHGILAVLLVLALAGCGVQRLAKGEIKPPKVTLEGLTLGGAHGGGMAGFRQA